MSFGFIVLNKLGDPETPEFSTGIPSIIIKGSLLAVKEAPPRIRIRLPEPGAPPLGVTCTPATITNHNNILQ